MVRKERRVPAGKEWQVIWERWIKLALQGCGYASLDQLPALNVPEQLLTSGLLIMADWIASNTDYFPLLELEEKGDSLVYPQRLEEGWRRLSLPQPWTPMTYCFDMDDFRERFGFSWNTVQQSVIRAVAIFSHSALCYQPFRPFFKIDSLPAFDNAMFIGFKPPHRFA